MTVFDVITHVLPALELVYEEGNPVIRGRWDDVGEHLVLDGEPGLDGGGWENPWLALRREDGEPAWPAGAGERREPIPAGVLHDQPRARLQAMDREGVARHLVLPGPFTVSTGRLDRMLAFGLLDGYNRYLTTYCEADPQRLRGVLQTHASFPEIAAERLSAQAGHPAVAGASVILPPGLTYASSELEPIWAVLVEHDLTLVHHEYASAPGVASAVGAEQLLRELLVGGVLDRHPQLRVALTGSGAGWLTSALPRLARAAEAAGSASLPDRVAQGRIAIALSLDEPEAVALEAIVALGEEALMWGSHFPGPRSRFPASPASVAAWRTVSSAARERLLVTNAERMFGPR